MTDFPDKIDIKLDDPCYIGSVQNLYDVPGHPDLLVSETTAGGSVFDVGTIFNIDGSDIGRAGFRQLVFQELQNPDAWKELTDRFFSSESPFNQNELRMIEGLLSDFRKNGAVTHHGGMIERESGKVYSNGFPENLSNLTLIKKFEIEKPDLKNVLGWHFYDYEKYHHINQNVIPLEYIVRLGVTSGSSILRKYRKLSESDRNTYLNELGVESLDPWTRFVRPIVDLTTKYEPEDRNISRQEAAAIAGVAGDTFSRSLIMAILGAFMLQQIFSRMGLYLWDMKWEIARDRDDLVFVDTIDTDSVRVTYNLCLYEKCYFVHFNKQAMRDYYKIMHPKWLEAVNEAKKKAALSGKSFTEILSEGQSNSIYPKTPHVDRQFLDIQTEKFNMIQSFIKNPVQDIQKEAERIARTELDYYFDSNRKKEYEELNSV